MAGEPLVEGGGPTHTVGMTQTIESTARGDEIVTNPTAAGSLEQYSTTADAVTALGETKTRNIGPLTSSSYIRAANEDLAEDIDYSEYQAGLNTRENLFEQSLNDLATAREASATTDASLTEAEANLRTAMTAFADVELRGDQEALTAAWTDVSSAMNQWNDLKETADHQLSELEDADNTWEKNSIWLEKYKNDYEAQSDPFAVRDRIARCGTEYCSATSFLSDEKFTAFQPNVLEMVGAHHAYAKGLTGKGVRIGIEDDIVNYRLPEFAGRISFDGAVLAYPVPYGDDYFSESKRCERASASMRVTLGCKVISYTTEYDLIKTLTARWTVANYGWPEEEENWFIRNDAHEEGSWLRWAIIPHGTNSSHGTRVASIAAGRDFGVAPGATVVPIAKDFSSEGQSDQRATNRSLLRLIRDLSVQDRRELDSLLAV